ncbi:hypothetical protein ACQ86N_36425 [Puia sp. P3]|uniref:hypothetical protein n=1 Tax=Puia sp. P3 TaxID=3423952 RepID=UPI003D66E7D0
MNNVYERSYQCPTDASWRPGRANNSRFLGSFSRRLRIEGIENGGTDKNGEKQSDYIHADTKKERLPAADRVESSSIHWILTLVFKGYGCDQPRVSNRITAGTIAYFISSLSITK